MISPQKRLDEICCEKTYKKLYAVGMELTRKNPEITNALPDAIQDVFLLLCKRYSVLSHHDSIEGWLVVALKYRLMDIKKAHIRDSRHVAFSFDDDDRLADRLKAEAAPSLSNQPIFELMEERLAAMEDAVGADNMRLVESYYGSIEDGKEVAQLLGITQTALRKRVSRICIKIRAMHMITIFFLLIKSQIRT